MPHDDYEPVLKKSRWCLLKQQESLTDKRLCLRDLLQCNLRTWLLCVTRRCLRQCACVTVSFRSDWRRGPHRPG